MNDEDKPQQGDELTKSEFDRLAREGKFVDGPYVSRFGDGYGDPYNPNREAWGTLKDGRMVWAWVMGTKVKNRTKEPTCPIHGKPAPGAEKEQP